MIVKIMVSYGGFYPLINCIGKVNEENYVKLYIACKRGIFFNNNINSCELCIFNPVLSRVEKIEDTVKFENEYIIERLINYLDNNENFE